MAVAPDGDGRFDLHARRAALEQGEEPLDFGEHLLGRGVSGEDVTRPRMAGGLGAVRRSENEKRDVARDRVGAHRPDGRERALGILLEVHDEERWRVGGDGVNGLLRRGDVEEPPVVPPEPGRPLGQVSARAFEKKNRRHGNSRTGLARECTRFHQVRLNPPASVRPGRGTEATSS